MATANPIEVSEREDNFELELERVRENVKRTFVELFECLKRRENELLSELDKILERDSETIKQFNEVQLRTSSVKELIKSHSKDIKEKLTQPQMVRFVCDNNKKLISETY